MKRNKSKVEYIVCKVLGLIAIALGVLLLYTEYLVIKGIGAVGAWIAGMIGATGAGATGIVLITYIPLIVLMLAIAVIAGVMFLAARWLFKQ